MSTFRQIEIITNRSFALAHGNHKAVVKPFHRNINLAAFFNDK